MVFLDRELSDSSCDLETLEYYILRLLFYIKVCRQGITVTKLKTSQIVGKLVMDPSTLIP